MIRRRFAMSAAHPVFPGHFPDHPVVPGAWLLDQVLAALDEAGEPGPWQLAAAKFLTPVGPDAELELTIEAPSGEGQRTFRILLGDVPVANGRIGPLER